MFDTNTACYNGRQWVEVWDVSIFYNSRGVFICAELNITKQTCFVCFISLITGFLTIFCLVSLSPLLALAPSFPPSLCCSPPLSPPLFPQRKGLQTKLGVTILQHRLPARLRHKSWYEINHVALVKFQCLKSGNPYEL